MPRGLTLEVNADKVRGRSHAKHGARQMDKAKGVCRLVSSGLLSRCTWPLRRCLLPIEKCSLLLPAPPLRLLSRWRHLCRTPSSRSLPWPLLSHMGPPSVFPSVCFLAGRVHVRRHSCCPPSVWSPETPWGTALSCFRRYFRCLLPPPRRVGFQALQARRWPQPLTFLAVAPPPSRLLAFWLATCGRRFRSSGTTKPPSLSLRFPPFLCVPLGSPPFAC